MSYIPWEEITDVLDHKICYHVFQKCVIKNILPSLTSLGSNLGGIVNLIKVRKWENANKNVGQL